ncbi:hypothetical protein OG689_44175 [Kitasatospora sp. NBC_00240]|uniref:hypothetical protein n=1 Tax=Kitasatospora sp. NBC_00240 TaxID=2903567 RepID=UPI00225BE728|nr:hypothetical protein [Kitasatospora sp. NBC_00240]MCX5216135.1 hypothetical protein [Kitasatospora sp. NBC_00240]
MTETARTRLLATALDTADGAATVAAAAAAGLTTYRALATRPAETRLTLTGAATALAFCVADQATTLLRRPLRRHLGLPAYGYTAPLASPAAAPSPGQLTAEAAVDAAHRAATHAHTLDHGSGSLTQPANWTGASDGTASCELTPDARLLCVPAPSDRYGAGARTYYLAADGERPIEVHTLSELVALLDRLAAGLGLDRESDDDQAEHDLDYDQHADGEQLDHGDLDDEDDQDPEAREALFAGTYSEEPPF